MPTLLDRLAAVSALVPESAELSKVAALPARHVSLSTSRLTAAAQDPAHAHLVDAAVRYAQRSVGKGGNRKLVAMRAVERLTVEFARALSEQITGFVGLELDGRLAFQKRATIDKARALVSDIEELGVPRERIVVKLPATLEGIEATEVLSSKSGVRCQLTLVLGMHQVAAAADAGAHSIAPPVGRITDYHKQAGTEAVDGVDPSLALVRSMREYLRAHGYPTLVVPYAFRSVDQVLALAGFEALTLSTTHTDELASRTDDAELTVAAPTAIAGERLVVDAPTWNRMHAADGLATSKLSDGVRSLGFAVVSQEKQLGEWISARQDAEAESTVNAFFQVWDYDGDGYIDREEWNGTEAVFNALDRDKDGRISVEELARGLGAPAPSKGG
ncbi:MAG: hypothetical protein FJ095_06475 [Deltaproteobacteria bacterium]|nr:hypothetical protein [Deltaproteobacteria bacterium]